MLTIQELRQLPLRDLLEEMERVSRDYLKLKMDVEEGFAKESHKAKALRRQIARIRTVEREIITEKAGSPVPPAQETKEPIEKTPKKTKK